MRLFKQLTAIVLVFTLFAAVAPVPLAARTRKADKLAAQGRILENRKDWDGALELYAQALSDDPVDPGYQAAVTRVQFQAAQAHIDRGLVIRNEGRLADALVEFQRAYAINPGSAAADQEIRRTQQMIQREKKSGENIPPEERGLTPAQLSRKRTEENIANMLPVPELKPLNQQPINIKMNNQAPRVLFETVGKLAGINVLFDPEFTPGKNQSIEINSATLDEALDYVGMVTKSFWKPLSANTIFVTNDNTTKRRDYEEQVMRVFYLTNVTAPQELQEIVTAVRSVADIQRLFVYTAQNAIIARGEADRIALAEKIVSDLDKPKSEVVVDVIVMQTTTAVTRNLAATLLTGGINQAITYNPRTSIAVQLPGTTPAAAAGAVAGAATAATTTAIPLSHVGKWATSDYATTLPNGLLQAMLNDRGTRVLQSPQIRSLDNQKASLKIGDRVPTATGSFQPGIGGVGINPLVNTQFTYIDVGVNVDITPRVHENNEISMHVEIEISSVKDTVNLGGVNQPVISQQKAIHDIRLRDGQINLLGGIRQQQEIKTLVGIPILSNIPLLKYLFSNETVDRSNNELLIALIPHIVRRPDINDQNLRPVAVGNATVVKLNYGPRPAPAAMPAPATPLAPAAMPASDAPPAPPVPAIPPTPVAPPAATTAPAAAPRVLLVPAQVETQANGAVQVNLVLENGVDIAAAPIQVKFDPKVLRLDDIVKGNLLSSDGQQVLFTKNILNDTGDATVNLNRMPGANGVSGSGTLVTLNFQAIGRGIATVSVPQFTARNSQGQPVLTASPVATVTVK